MEQEKRAVLVTEQERRWVKRGLRLAIAEVKKQEKGLSAMEMSTEPCREAMAVLEGDGVNGGLLTRFAPQDSTGDLLAKATPHGQVRRLYFPQEGQEPTEVEPVDAEAWADRDIPEALAAQRLYEAAEQAEHYFEDEAGQVYQLLLRGAVEWEYVGRRPEEEVDEAVEASEAAQEGQEPAEQSSNGAGNINALDALPWGSPAARELAKAEKLEVERLAGRGTGAGGRITKRDVLDVLEERDESEPEPEPAA